MLSILWQDENNAGKTSTLGRETVANRNFSNFQIIYQNFYSELFAFSHSQKFIVEKLFNIKTFLI